MWHMDDDRGISHCPKIEILVIEFRQCAMHTSLGPLSHNIHIVECILCKAIQVFVGHEQNEGHIRRCPMGYVQMSKPLLLAKSYHVNLNHPTLRPNPHHIVASPYHTFPCSSCPML